MTEFEIQAKDGMGRLAELRIAGHEITTPALMPVVNPHLTPPDLGPAQAAITNAYVLYNSEDHRDAAVDDGLHELLDFDGLIATDSGAYQASVYGDDVVEVTNREILEFQDAVGSDLATPLDVPTPPDADESQAERDLEVTRRRTREAREMDLDAALNVPIQGGVHPETRRWAAERAVEGDVYPIGAVVPLMQEYRYRELVDVVVGVKRGLPADSPVHLFGAGHPATFALATALGCDLYDSAAYALYAEERRYLTPTGTYDVSEMDELPCECPTCQRYEPYELGYREIARHNLEVSYAELRRVREAIRGGRLLELVARRATMHPKLKSGVERLSDHAETVEKYDPAVKSAFFDLGGFRRPEVERHQRRLERLRDLDADRVVVTPRKDVRGRRLVLVPSFGPVAPELRSTYPLNSESVDVDDASPRAQLDAVEGVERLARQVDAEVVFEHPGWRAFDPARLREHDVEVVDLEAAG